VSNGQVVLALRVVRRKRVQALEQRLEREAVQAAVDFPNAALLGGRVPFLDNALDAPGGIAHDASVAVRIGQRRGQDRRGRLCLTMMLDQTH
jgi:hypothetical protein